MRTYATMETGERGFRWALSASRDAGGEGWGVAMLSAWKESPDLAWEDLLHRMLEASATRKRMVESGA